MYELTDMNDNVIAVAKTQNDILKHCRDMMFLSRSSRRVYFELNKATLHASFRKNHGSVYRLYRDIENEDQPTFILTVK